MCTSSVSSGCSYFFACITPPCCRGKKCTILDSLSNCFVARIASAIVNFIRTHWKMLTAYVVALSLIVGLMSRIHGFEKVGKPLLIGISMGSTIGFLMGIVFHGARPDSADSMWQLFKRGVLSEVDTITSSIVVSAVVAFFMHTLPYFPVGVGVIGGVGAGNDLIMQILRKEKSEHANRVARERRDQVSPLQGAQENL